MIAAGMLAPSTQRRVLESFWLEVLVLAIGRL